MLQSARLLIKAGADPFIPDDLGSPPIHYAVQLAAETGNTDFVQLLFAAMYGDGCKVRHLTLAAAELIGQLLSATPGDGVSSRHTAAAKKFPNSFIHSALAAVTHAECTVRRCCPHHILILQEFSASLKLKPDKIIPELRQLAKQARPMVAACSSSTDSRGGSSSSSNLEGVLELPPAALCRARMLLMVAQNKFKTFDQVS